MLIELPDRAEAFGFSSRECLVRRGEDERCGCVSIERLMTVGIALR